MLRKSVVGISLMGIAFVAAPAFAGPEWIEGAAGQGDAGRVIGDAQKTFGQGQLGFISGSLDGVGFGQPGDYVDMYLITVTDPANFSIGIFNADFDAQLFLFNVTLPGQAFGLLANDNAPGGDGTSPFLTPLATDGSGAALTVPGVYAIAISGSGHNPVSVNGLIFNFGIPDEVSGPDGPGGINPHIDWIGDGVSGSYTLVLTGSGFYDVPAPGALALLGLAGLIGRRSRRR